MNYFDFHLHPTLKPTLKAGQPYDLHIPGNAVSGVPGLCTDLPRIVGSQASLEQLQQLGRKLLGVALYSIERVIASDRALNQVAAGNAKLKKYVGVERLREIATNQLPAFDYLMQELLPVYETKPEFRIVSRDTDLSNLDPRFCYVFFVLEGCHSLCNSSNKDFDVQEILTNLGTLADRVPLLSVNLTHLQKSNICNQAYGIQLTNNDVFIPRGNGLSADGEAVVQACFDRGICIDVKHMSLAARRQLFQQLANGHYRNPQPVLCTHAGFTGIPSGELADYILSYEEQEGCVYVVHGKPNHIAPNDTTLRRPAPTFNASSINLYDEEIVAIVKSGGMIGLSLDRRIGGYVDIFDKDHQADYDGEDFVVDREYFSADEFRSFGINRSNISRKVRNDWCNMESDLQEASALPDQLIEFHRAHFMGQLRHFLQLCLDAGIPLEEAQKKICIGSDFDGIINTLYCAESVVDLPALKRYLKAYFPDFLGRYKEARQWRDELDMKVFLEDLFYNNGVAFVQQRLAALANGRPSGGQRGF